jgi:hypothetical protein
MEPSKGALNLGLSGPLSNLKDTGSVLLKD